MRHLHSLRIVFILSVGMGVARGGLAAQEEAADSTRLFKAAISETGSDMSLEELSRDANRSLVRMEIRLATSVGGSSWIVCQMAELTKHRGSRYHVVLDVIEQTAPAGGERFPMTVTMDVGFLNSDAVDLKAEFGLDSFDEGEGDILDSQMFALMCGPSGQTGPASTGVAGIAGLAAREMMP